MRVNNQIWNWKLAYLIDQKDAALQLATNSEPWIVVKSKLQHESEQQPAETTVIQKTWPKF